MSDSAETSSFEAAAGQDGTAPVAASPVSRYPSESAPAGSDRPELAVGAAFAGGFVAALILKRLAG